MNRKYKYTDEEFKEAIRTSSSKRQVLEKLGIVAAGGNYACLSRKIKKLNVDTSHFTGYSWNRGKTFGPKQDISVYINNKLTIQSFKLKGRLIKEGYLEPKCSCCNLTTWLGDPIPLELDHIDGNSEDNKLENLRLLCPNCHALTPTYRGKNKKLKRFGSALPD
jgi:Zn finger protein HypA/HybF involved in hydrogenase expression